MVVLKTFPDFGEDAGDIKGAALDELRLDLLSNETLRIYRMSAPAAGKFKGDLVHLLLAKLYKAANNKVCACLAPCLSNDLKSSLGGGWDENDAELQNMGDRSWLKVKKKILDICAENAKCSA